MFKLKHLLTSSLILIVIIAGCSAKEDITSAEDIHNKLLASMDEQQNYSFKGTTALTISKETMNDVITFTGQVNDKDNLYLDMIIEGVSNISDDRMEIFKSSEGMKIKYRADEKWQQVSLNDYDIINQINSWDPEEILNVIRTNMVSVEKVEGKENYAAILVEIDSSEIRDDIEKQLSSQVQKEDVTEDSVYNNDELLNTLDINTNYLIYYNPDNYRIEQIIQNTTTNYNVSGDNMEEIMTITIDLYDYGKNKDILE